MRKQDKEKLKKYGLGFLVFFVVVSYIGYTSIPAGASAYLNYDVNGDGEVNPQDLYLCYTHPETYTKCGGKDLNVMARIIMNIPSTALLAGEGSAYTCNEADASKDGIISLVDLATIGQAWDTVTGDIDYNVDADLDKDGDVDLTDLAILGQWWAEGDETVYCDQTITTTTSTTTTSYPGQTPQAEHFELGAVVTKSFDVSTTKVLDSYHQDGNVLYLHAKWVLIKDGVEIDGVEQELSTSSYSYTFSVTISETGNYIYSLVLYSAESHYDGGWSEYVFTEEDSKIYPFTVGYPQPPNPIWDTIIGSFINGLSIVWSAITGWISFL